MRSILPEGASAYLQATYGAPSTIELLRGLSDAQVWRVRWAHHSVIVKATTKQQEAAFYERIAPRLQTQHIPLPRLERFEHLPHGAWMVLEDIPTAFPRARWLADPKQITVLRRLHHASGIDPSDLPDAFVPQWTERMTDAALAWFPPPTAATLLRILEPLRMLAQPLFAPRCPISGDPNPTNWGLRHDNSVVLFDWERFGWGTPALDLAITIPGLGDTAAFRSVAAAYLGADERAAVEQWAKELGLAKVWSLVEFLSMFAIENSPPPTIADLQQAFPSWLHHLASARTSSDRIYRINTMGKIG